MVHQPWSITHDLPLHNRRKERKINLCSSNSEIKKIVPVACSSAAGHSDKWRLCPGNSTAGRQNMFERSFWCPGVWPPCKIRNIFQWEKVMCCAWSHLWCIDQDRDRPRPGGYQGFWSSTTAAGWHYSHRLQGGWLRRVLLSVGQAILSDIA